MKIKVKSPILDGDNHDDNHGVRDTNHPLK